jgi:hypothetical protein
VVIARCDFLLLAGLSGDHGEDSHSGQSPPIQLLPGILSTRYFTQIDVLKPPMPLRTMNAMNDSLLNERVWTTQSTRSTRVNLAEHNLLELVVKRQDTSTGDTTKDVGTSTLEERLVTLAGDDLAVAVEHGLVVDGSTRSHHHTTTDGVERVRGETSTNRDTPAEQEGREERALESANEYDRLCNYT